MQILSSVVDWEGGNSVSTSCPEQQAAASSLVIWAAQERRHIHAVLHTQQAFHNLQYGHKNARMWSFRGSGFAWPPHIAVSCIAVYSFVKLEAKTRLHIKQTLLTFHTPHKRPSMPS